MDNWLTGFSNAIHKLLYATSQNEICLHYQYSRLKTWIAITSILLWLV